MNKNNHTHTEQTLGKGENLISRDMTLLESNVQYPAKKSQATKNKQTNQKKTKKRNQKILMWSKSSPFTAKEASQVTVYPTILK